MVASWFGLPDPLVQVSLRQAARSYEEEDGRFKMKCSKHPLWKKTLITFLKEL